jgi:hypothetical protein
MKIPDDDLEASAILLNNAPLDDLLGLSPTEMHHLVYDTFGEKSPVNFREDIDDKTLDQIPLFRIAEEFLKIIQRDKYIKLTPLGALPVKVMVELYDKRFLLEYYFENRSLKYVREQDSISIRSARYSAELAGLVKKVNGKLSLTKKATKLLETKNRVQIFKQFFQGFTEKFSWSYNDGYSEKIIGQLGWAFTVVMLDKYGEQSRTVHLYANKYLKAFPVLIQYLEPDYSTPEEQFPRCYGIRAFERFLLWFGFVTVDRYNKYPDTDTDEYKRTDLVKRIFNIDDL